MERTTLGIADSAQEIEEFSRLLFAEYCLRLRWHDASNFPDGVFRDPHDRYGVFLTVRRGTKMLGGFRLVWDSEGGFPHEDLLPYPLPNLPLEVASKLHQQLRNCQRSEILAVTRLIGGCCGKRPFTIEAVKCLYWYAVNHGVKAYFMVIDMNLFLLCQNLFVPLQPIGIPKFCEGSWTIPSILLIEDLAGTLSHSNRLMWEYVSDPSNLTGNWFST